MQDSDFGDSGLPFFRETRPARAPALHWTSALCSAGAPAGSKTTHDDFPNTPGFRKRLTCYLNPAT